MNQKLLYHKISQSTDRTFILSKQMHTASEKLRVSKYLQTSIIRIMTIPYALDAGVTLLDFPGQIEK